MHVQMIASPFGICKWGWNMQMLFHLWFLAGRGPQGFDVSRLMSSDVALAPWHFAIEAAPQSHNQQRECNEGDLGELEVIRSITSALNKTDGTGMEKKIIIIGTEERQILTFPQV